MAVRELSVLGVLRGLSGQFRMGQLKTQTQNTGLGTVGRPGLGIWLKKAEEDITGNFFKGEGRKAKKKRCVYANFTNSVKADWDWLALNYYRRLNASLQRET